MRTLAASTLLFMLLSGCASPRPTLRPDQARQRLRDTPAEKMAGIPVPDPAADPENQDRRFGVESARERNETVRRQREERRRCVDVIARNDATGGKPVCPPSQK
jgi:hypothetical protein